MNTKEELELAQRWYETIHPNIFCAYIDYDDLYIIIDENDEYHIQVSSKEIKHRANLFAEILNN